MRSIEEDSTHRKRPFSRRLRDFLYYRQLAFREAVVRKGRGWLKHRIRRRLVPFRLPPGPLKLHVGSGTERLDGWVNIDLQPLVEVDVCADVTRRFPYSGVHRIFAEHFLEHLALDDAVNFLVRCREALGLDGRLRLTTPNLDWVWSTQYTTTRSKTGVRDSPAAVQQALDLNRGFYAWGHRFLWNRQILEAALEAAGFVDLVWPQVGESDDVEFSGLERHETWEDTPELPHVLVVEADRGERRPELLAAFRERAEREFLSMLPTTHR